VMRRRILGPTLRSLHAMVNVFTESTGDQAGALNDPGRATRARAAGV
jgi:hypothetical protein